MLLPRVSFTMLRRVSHSHSGEQLVGVWVTEELGLPPGVVLDFELLPVKHHVLEQVDRIACRLSRDELLRHFNF